jgi:hypothetical protein
MNEPLCSIVRILEERLIVDTRDDATTIEQIRSRQCLTRKSNDTT